MSIQGETTSNKQPIRRLEIPISKFNDVAIPHHIGMLKRHKTNIAKVVFLFFILVFSYRTFCLRRKKTIFFIRDINNSMSFRRHLLSHFLLLFDRSNEYDSVSRDRRMESNLQRAGERLEARKTAETLALRDGRSQRSGAGQRYHKI